jgi:DNA invertase Pin-like site-specific DNA recombinase
MVPSMEHAQSNHPSEADCQTGKLSDGPRKQRATKRTTEMLNRRRSKSSSPPTTPVPVAQYVRMSTDHQHYSIENQKAAIQEYAEQHGFAIVQTYCDAGKSGVVIRHRAGLTKLIQEVVGGKTNYKAILVYDVSRWGRFQDIDEAAHYEFLCKNSGVPVHYCAEQFANDGTLPSSVLKFLKRMSAADFSHDLGVKTFDGKSRLALLGFRMGGTAGYGLRRMMISARLTPKQTLERGEYKSLSTDRIILVPGPRNEIECVANIYKMVNQDRLGPTQIADRLNQQGIPYLEGRLWNHERVRRILRNPKYAGCNVWNRTSQRLHTPMVSIAPQYWISKAGAFASIVSQETFDCVQTIMRKKRERTRDKELLRGLKRLLAAKGRLTQNLISEARNLASTATYYSHFGTLRRSYELIGYDPGQSAFVRTDHRIRTLRLREEIVGALKAMFPERVTVLPRGKRGRAILSIDGDFKVSLIICPTCRTAKGKLRWTLEPVPTEREYITLLCRLNSRNNGFHSFYMFQRVDRPKQCRLKEDDTWLTTGKRLWELSDFYGEAKRIFSIATQQGSGCWNSHQL